MFRKKKKQNYTKYQPTRYLIEPRLNTSASHDSSVNLNMIFLTVLFLVCGLLMIYSASALIAYIYQDGDTFFYFKRQIIWIVIGSFLGFIFYNLSPKQLRFIGQLMLIGGFVLLLYLIPEAVFHVEFPLVKTLNGATRWIDLKFFDLQPSEFIKFPLVIFTASWLSFPKKIPGWIEDFKKSNDVVYSSLVAMFVFFPFIILGLVSLLILLERDLDTLVIIVLTFLTIFYVAGTTTQHSLITVFTIIGSLIGGTLAMLLEPYRRARVDAFVDIVTKGQPSSESILSDSFQVWNGLIAIGSGGIASASIFFGLGYGESKQKLFFLQEAAYTDSIFAIIAEEFGIIGALVVILGFLYFASLGVKIAQNAKDKFSANLAIGLTAWIVIQAFLNIAANLAVIPFGGMPLPFFTYGGSNTIMILIAVGTLLGISKHSSKSQRKPAKASSRVVTRGNR
jgi:cell division protein FtsW